MRRVGRREGGRDFEEVEFGGGDELIGLCGLLLVWGEIVSMHANRS